jgi:ribose-phosphate pyrophosphokinase
MINKYPDGSSYAKIEQFNKEFTFKINSYEDLWHLKQITDVYEHQGLRPVITIPCLIDQQADDRFNSNESFGLKLVCEFLNSMYADFKIFHPHNPNMAKALMDNVEIIDNSQFIKTVLNTLHNDKHRNHCGTLQDTHFDEKISDYLTLFSSDAGGFKPLMKLADKLNWEGEVYGASKSRKYENRESKLIQQIDKQDFNGRDILIIDDICIYGGTFKGLSKLLKECNCGKLYLAVSHMTVQHLGEDPVTNYFDKVFTTNSKYDSYIVHEGLGKFEIIKLF